MSKIDITSLPLAIQTQLDTDNVVITDIEPKELIKYFIKNMPTHKHYDRVVKMAETNKILATGEGAGELLKQFNPRESAEAFEQRKSLTKVITSAMYNSVKQPFNKANRNNNIVVRVDIKDKTADVETMIDKFYKTHKHSTAQGLNYWLKNEYLDKSFIDPNSWLVVEWVSDGDRTKLYEPYPFVVSSKDAINYNIDNNELQWLFVQRAINYKSYDAKTKQYRQSNGTKFIYYLEGQTITATRCCKEYLTRQGLINNVELYENQTNEFYIIQAHVTNLDFVPAFRMGYVRDQVTEGETFTSPFQPAMCYFEKSVKTTSEFDLTTMLHLFAQKYEIGFKCDGTVLDGRNARCNNGKIDNTDDVCTVCNGTGYKQIMSAQDSIILTLDKEFDLSKLPDMSKLVHYETPPIETIKMQKELIDGFFLDAHRAMFNTTSMVEGRVLFTKTATEVESDYQGIYDALEPFTEKISELFKSIVTVFFHLTGASEKQIEGADLIHRFPADLKLKSLGQLLKDLERAKEAGAPPFLLSAISNDIADVIYNDSPMDKIKYDIKELFYPFSGKTTDEILQLMASDYVSKDDKILYANYETIWREIEFENPNFFKLESKNLTKMWEIIKAKLEEFKEAIREGGPQAPSTDVLLQNIKIEEDEETEGEN